MDNNTERALRFIQVSVDLNADGRSIQCWWGVERPPRWEALSYPYKYTYIGDMCDWEIYSSGELTPIIIHFCGEEADKQVLTGRKVNANRKLSNR